MGEKAFPGLRNAQIFKGRKVSHRRILNTDILAWRDGLVKSSACSLRGPWFSSQLPLGSSVTLTPVTEALAPSSGLYEALHTHGAQTPHSGKAVPHTNIKNIVVLTGSVF